MLATGGILLLARVVETSLYNTTAQTNLLMFEAKHKLNIDTQLARHGVPVEEREVLLADQSKLLNTARILNFHTFASSITRLVPTPDTTLENGEYAENLAYNDSLLYRQIRPENKNNQELVKLLLGDAVHVGTFSKEVASVGISEHYDKYSMTIIPEVFNRQGDSSSFEYALKMQPQELLYVEVKPFGARLNSAERVLSEYSRQLAKGESNVLLIIDYSNKNITPKLLEKIEEIQNDLKTLGMDNKIQFVNSSDSQILINQDILDYSETAVIPKLERNKSYFQTLHIKDQNILSGRTSMRPEDGIRIGEDFSKFYGTNDEITALRNYKRK